MELVPQQTTLTISTSRLLDTTPLALQKDNSRQVTQENQQAHRINSQAVDSAFHFLKVTKLSG